MIVRISRSVSHLVGVALWVLGLGWIAGNTVALGGNDAADTEREREVLDAERERLADEMETLAQRQAWQGVERKYQAMEALDAELTADDHLRGAYAARELGDVLQTYERLAKAAHLDQREEIVTWLWDLDQNYARVELLSVPARGTNLEIEEMPFDPNQRKAVAAAQASTRNDGNFVGMLPKGNYQFSGQEFVVEPGMAVRVEISPKARKQGIIEPVIVQPENPADFVTEE